MRRTVFVAIGMAFAGLTSCKKNVPQDLILGTWKIDSTYTFYNGFEKKQSGNNNMWPIYTYDGKISREIKSGTYRSFFYQIQGSDSLMLKPTQSGDTLFFSIVKLEKDRMVLKKGKDPLFSGENQKRYEIRYFSRTTPPKDSLIPFRDPRQLGS